MLNKKMKVMVVSHEASLSGAPVLLLNLFRLLIEKRKVEVQFVIRHDGPLVGEFAKVAPVIVLKSTNYGLEKSGIDRLKNFIKSKIQLLKILIKATSCDYLFFNTVVNGKMLRWFYFHGKPAITYVHELEKVIDLYLKQKDAVLPLSLSKVIACPTNTTRKLLLERYKVPEYKLKKLQYYFPFTASQYNPVTVSQRKAFFRGRFQVKESDFLIGGMGVVSDRKGIDLFIEVCKKLVSKKPIKFFWIGRFESKEQEIDLRQELKKNQLEEKLFFTGPLQYDLYNLCPFDIFFLSSKEDTYPLVVLEAAMMKVPAICFSGSGGIVEFTGCDAGWVVEGFSTDEAALKLDELEQMRSVVSSYGESAFNKVILSHCSPDIILSQYASIIEVLN
jgi:glycosyltransferase involved in cell wall biosynthesis